MFFYQVIYFPYNIDFRGRTYPIPPYLNHIGSDLCRGLLYFHKGKKLGKDGWKWLRIHCSNKMGNDKISFQDRAEYVDDHISDIIDSAHHPLTGDRWWLKGDSPFQCLAACIEIANALRCKNPEDYICPLPIHQDGSCNGLQHYAALLLDESGAKAVNLVGGEKPRDVYSGVLQIVKEKVKMDLNSVETEQEEFAKILKGGDVITRKIIKQTVMTSVYGVTDVGARKQIENQLKAFQITFDPHKELDDTNIWKLALYLTQKTMSSIGEVNIGASNAMKWLNDCASLVSHNNYPMMWTTPLGN